MRFEFEALPVKVCNIIYLSKHLKNNTSLTIHASFVHWLYERENFLQPLFCKMEIKYQTLI